MAQASGAMHVARVVGRYTAKSGEHREYVSHLLRRTCRADGKVRHETLANLSPVPAAAIEAVRASLAGKTLLVAGEDLEVTRSLPHGHVAAVLAQAQRLGLPNLLGPVGRQRDVAVALIVARVCRPGSKLATTRWWTDTTLAADLGLTEVITDEAYAAMDWLLDRQDAIEAALADRHLSAPVNPDRLALFDLSSSWMTGSHCPLAARGYSRDGKKGLPQIEYGLLTDPVGRPVAVRVVAGNTADPTAFAHLATDVRDRFGLTDLVLVGDRGMITKARIEQLRDLGGLGWVTALRAPDVAALARDDGPLQMSLFDQANLAEITHPDFPDERLIAWSNPARAADRAGLRQAIRRSSGKSGWVISARFAWSNRLICSGPSSRASAATSGARRAVTQPRPPRSRSCSIRALVIIPRSPTSTRSVNPKRSRTSVARWANAVGSAVLPATTRTATGRPTGSVSSPYSICGSPFLPSRE